MRVRLIKIKTIEDYVLKNARSKIYFENWLSIIKRADWNTPNDMIVTFNSADLLGRGSDRVIFNIGGNRYRLICKYYFGESNVHLLIKWIGTHAECTKLCKAGNQYEVDLY